MSSSPYYERKIIVPWFPPIVSATSKGDALTINLYYSISVVQRRNIKAVQIKWDLYGIRARHYFFLRYKQPFLDLWLGTRVVYDERNAQTTSSFYATRCFDSRKWLALKPFTGSCSRQPLSNNPTSQCIGKVTTLEALQGAQDGQDRCRSCFVACCLLIWIKN
ncbi:hypothetical protein EJ08DRAFT_648745 [Tothia fuscella]|uniref:Uncharacterized protein n=1 Tax=Tothia fuscella TaxID=1048955 RepID=A0A9P4NU36_9PEZI|nr:hypothetical protein EJ08DRAFT_648745 [Tothia fuscella]